MWSDSLNFLEGVKQNDFLQSWWEENQNSFGKTTSYNIISVIILNNNYETIMSLKFMPKSSDRSADK